MLLSCRQLSSQEGKNKPENSLHTISQLYKLHYIFQFLTIFNINHFPVFEGNYTEERNNIKQSTTDHMVLSWSIKILTIIQISQDIIFEHRKSTNNHQEMCPII